jgi:hypothetical protein
LGEINKMDRWTLQRSWGDLARKNLEGEHGKQQRNAKAFAQENKDYVDDRCVRVLLMCPWRIARAKLIR